MGDRGSVHAYRAAWTEPDPDNPGKRRKRFAKTWTYRFEWRRKRYVGADKYETKREALNAGEKRKAEVLRGLEADPTRTTFAALDRLLAAEGAAQKDSTGASTLACLARLRKVFDPTERLAEMKRARVLECLGQLRALGLQESTIRLTMRHLKRAMDLAYEEGTMLAVPKFPWEKIKVTPRKETVQPHELEKILQYLPEHWLRYYVVSDETGWRGRSELRSRKWTDVDWGPPGWLHLDAEHAKTGKARKFPITETGTLRAVLKEQREWVYEVEAETGQVIPWIFCQPNGKQLGDTRKAWATATRRAGFGKLEGRKGPWSSAKVAHDIRRTVLRRWKALGEPMDVRMAVAGHESAEAHMGYTEGDEASMQAFAERVEEKRRETAERVVSIRKA